MYTDEEREPSVWENDHRQAPTSASAVLFVLVQEGLSLNCQEYLKYGVYTCIYLTQPGVTLP